VIEREEEALLLNDEMALRTRRQIPRRVAKKRMEKKRALRVPMQTSPKR
jgi:hypothetical protein